MVDVDINVHLIVAVFLTMMVTIGWVGEGGWGRRGGGKILPSMVNGSVNKIELK